MSTFITLTQTHTHTYTNSGYSGATQFRAGGRKYIKFLSQRDRKSVAPKANPPESQSTTTQNFSLTRKSVQTGKTGPNNRSGGGWARK